MNQRSLSPSAVLLAFAAVWTPAMLASAYAWRNGEYYDYGWFVPPAALLLLYKRWRESRITLEIPRWKTLSAAAALILPLFLVLRILNHTDPSWRLPMALLALTAAAVCHLVIAASAGWRVSARFSLITILLLSAVPWPSVIEQDIVNTLTRWVTTSVAEIFQILGKPVGILGDRLTLHDLTVEVTDGCSGVRSFQSFVMATWFFSELQRLRWYQSFLLLNISCIIGLVVNIGRTYALAHIRFFHGETAFDRAHDLLGLVAFVISAALFFLISGKLSSRAPRKVVRMRQSL